MRVDDVPVRPLPVAGCPLVAHTPAEAAPEHWHSLADHLRGVADLAAAFAAPFGGGTLLRFVGLVHDAGKAVAEVQAAFQRRGQDGGATLGVPHKLEGAALASLLVEAGKPAAARVACLASYGHHHQVPAWDPPDGWPASRVLEVMKDDPGRLDALVERLDAELGLSLREVAAAVEVPAQVSLRRPRDLELFARMCHSALVDADFLDTAQHFTGAEAPRRHVERGAVVLRDAFLTSYLNAYATAPSTPVNVLRQALFEHCRRVGAESPLPAGVYRLPAQTGSGKTMAAAAFALEHAVATGKRRVIVAVPYTSITTQNAAEYRLRFAGLGEDVVLEHHSNIINDAVADEAWRRLSAANWDAEFVVTTTVQLLDSLFSNRPSKTRKLHRLADAVLVIDEVQALPLPMLPAVLQMLRELTEHYGLTVLLASATQPSFWALPVWDDLPRHDLAEVNSVPEVTRRVRYEMPTGQQDWPSIADDVARHAQVLVIVNTTSDAQQLHALIEDVRGKEEVLHLSTRMCGQHRLDVLNQTRDRLRLGQPVILVSTQVIEAGVDVDFPIVYRAMAPAESLVQSAGRCNREGMLGTAGGVVRVFEPRDGGLPPGPYTAAARLTRFLFVEEAAGLPADDSRRAVLDDPRSLSRYYQRLYTDHLYAGTSAQSSMLNESRRELDYPATADRFSLIDSTTLALVTTSYGTSADRADLECVLDDVRHDPGLVLDRRARRLLARFTVQIPPHRLSGLAEVLPSGVSVWSGDYHPRRGVELAPTSQATIW